MKNIALLIIIGFSAMGCSNSEKIAEYCALKAEANSLAAQAVSGALDGSISSSRAAEMVRNAKDNAARMAELMNSSLGGKEPKCK